MNPGPPSLLPRMQRVVRAGDGILANVAGGRRRWWSDLGARRRRELLLATVLLFAYGFFQQRPAWNEFSRYDTVRALVEQGTTRIDTYHENTGDKAFYAGHWYSDKAPGSALLGVPVYVVATLTARLGGQDVPEDVAAIQAIAFVESGITTTLLVLLLIRFLAPVVGEGWATAVGLAYGFGSIAFPFATMFFGHAASTAALFASFYLLHRWRSKRQPWAPVAAGLLAGLAVLIEIPALIGVAVLGLYAVWIDRRGALAFILGGVPLAVVFAIYNWISFGGPFNLGYMNLLPGSFASGMSEGILGVRWPDPATAGDLLFGPRGLVRLAPWFVAVPVGLVAAARSRAIRAEVLVCAAITALFLIYNAGYYLPFGGWTPGPRFLLPALPFAAVLVGLIPRSARPAAAALMLLSIAVFFVATMTMPNAPERFGNPLFELWLPSLVSGQFAASAAWIRWGLDGFAGAAVVLVGIGFALLVLALSIARHRLGDATGRAVLVMAVLVAAFSVPVPPLAPVALGWAGERGPADVSVAQLGHTVITPGDREEVVLWARIENRGGAVPASRVQFTVWRSTGESVWAAYYGAVPVPASSRQTTSMTWQPDDAPAGSYRYGITILDASSEAELANTVAADAIVLRR